MPEKLVLPELQNRFGDRFGDMSLQYVELLHWPVWSHSLIYKTYEEIDLDVMQEGLLLLAQAGVRRLSEIAALLGCSETYTRTIATQLAASGEQHACLLFDGDEEVTPTQRTAAVLESRLHLVPAQKSCTTLRDAVFNTWLSYGDLAFHITEIPDTADGPQRWLDAAVSSENKDRGAMQHALELLPDSEIVEAHFESEGALQWVSLWLGCYQPSSGGRGRYMLFNPAREDAPLSALTNQLESSLRSSKLPPLYFPDGKLQTSNVFWNALASRVVLEKTSELIASQRVLLGELEEKQRDTASEHDPVTAIEPANSEVDALSSQHGVEALLSRYTEEIERLEHLLSQAPRIDHLSAEQHPAVLLRAIRDAQHLLILISPWIKMRVLRSLLPELDATLRRGVLILIGYGMPPSKYHDDKNDASALELLRDRQRDSQLWLEHLGTHEKVIVQDDTLFVNSSFNFFSFTGEDGRRESGTVQRGGVTPILSKFLQAFPEHIQAAVQERSNSAGWQLDWR